MTEAFHRPSFRAWSLVAPYAVWMVLMSALPVSASAYAVRGVATALLLGCTAFSYRAALSAFVRRLTFRSFALAVASGVVVLAIWIAPETWLWPRAPEAASSPYDPAICGWTLFTAKLLASAFVISAAEELFFRKWLVDFAGFWPTVALFAVEHGERWHVGALTGVVYGLLARRCGILAAIVAHAVTNLALGLFVLKTGRWYFW